MKTSLLVKNQCYAFFQDFPLACGMRQAESDALLCAQAGLGAPNNNTTQRMTAGGATYLGA